MSNSVDNRIVDMKFNNGQFQQGIANTLKSLDDLKAKLEFSGQKRSIADLQAAGQNFSLAQMGAGIDGLAAKFSALSAAGVTALATIVHKATEAGLALTNSLTLGPISEGFNDYNAKLTSVKTIMNATGESVQTVDGYFRQLDEYSDKTIYNLSDMTGAFAKFTNAGLDMDTSVPAIKGIANMVALAGQGADAASIAMYNLSQSISNGFLTTTDYKSLNLANVATKEWKDQMIAGAVAAGTLEESTDGMYNIPGSDKAYNDAQLFSEALSEGWASADVLTKVLGDYGDTTTEIGAKAQDAAQKVKSLPMMFETLRAAVGTQWTDTFEHLFGNVDEATDLFTGLTETIQPLIAASGDARNAMLKDWKELGGRDEAIQAIKNAWQALSNILGPIRDAFRQIFPRKTGEDLYNLTVKIREFTERLVAGEDTMDKIRRVFIGVFSVFKVFTTIVSGVIKVLFSLFDTAAGGTGGILTAAAAMGDFATMLSSWLTQSGALERFFGALASGVATVKPLVSFLFQIGGAIAALATGDIQAFKNQFAGAFEGMRDTLGDVGGRLQSFGQTVSETFKGIGDQFMQWSRHARLAGDTVMADLAVLGARIAYFFTDFGGSGIGKIGEVFSSLSGLFDRLMAQIQGVKDGMNFDVSFAQMSAGAGGASSSFAAMEETGSRVTSVFGKMMDVFGTIAVTIGTVVGNILDSIKTLTTKISDYISGMTFTEAVALFNTGVLIALYLAIKKFVDNLSEVIGAMTGAFGQLTDTLKSMQQAVRAQIILTIAIAVGILVAALLILANIDQDKLKQGLIGLGVLFAQLAATLVVISKYGLGASGVVAAGASLVLMAGAMVLLAAAVKIFATMSWEDMLKGLTAVGVLLGALILFTKFSSADGAGFKAGAGLVLLAFAIRILAEAVYQLGTMDTKSLIKGIIALGTMVGMLAAMVYLMNTVVGIPAAAFGLLILAAAITALLVPMLILSQIDFGVFILGLSMMALTLVSVAGAMMLFPDDMPKKAAGILIVAGAMVLLAGVIKTFGEMDVVEIAKGIATMAAALGILILAMQAAEKTLFGAQALLVVSGALLAIAAAMKILGSMDLESIGIALLAIVGVFAVLGLAGLILAPVIPALGALALVIMALAKAMLVAGLGFGIFAAGFALFASVGAAGVAVAIAGFEALLSLLPLFMEQLGLGIIAMAKVLGDGASALVDAFVKILLAMADGFSRVAGHIVELVADFIMDVIYTMAEMTPQIVAAGLDMLIAMLEAIRDRIYMIVDIAIDIIREFIRAIADNIGETIQSGIDFVLAFMYGLADGIRNNDEEMAAAGGDIGRAIVEGMATGMRNLGGFLRDTAEWVASQALDGALSFLGIRSPSREFIKIGRYVDEGFAVGMRRYSGVVVRATESVAGDALDTMKSTMSALGDAISGDVDFNPVIAPVIDLTDFRKGAGVMAGLLETDPVKANVSLGHASSLYAADAAASSEPPAPTEVVKEVKFEQNNYSPTALSTIDIYRNSRNLLSQAETALAKA